MYYVLVSQGIEILRTTRKEEAEAIMQEENEIFYEYKQKCLDNGEEYADTEIFMHKESERLDTLLEFCVVLSYNGYDKKIETLIRVIEEKLKTESYSITRPEEFDEIDYDHPIGIFWSLLVMLYGDYGTSPRYGWLEVENKEELLILCSMIKGEILEPVEREG